jgi:outer membrane lipoprotein-sorting protein
MKARDVAGVALAHLLILSSGPVTGEVLPEARASLARLESAVESLTAFEADFVQVRHLVLTDEEVRATGRIRFLAPDHFRLDFKTPEADVLTLRGDSLVMYFPALKQAQTATIEEEEATRDFFLLFSARKGEIERRFDVSLAADSPSGRPLRFQPLADSESPVREIWVHQNEKTGFPERLFLMEVGGDTILFQISRPRRNGKLESRDFFFAPPKGTEIISR